MTAKILIVDDEKDLRELLEEEFIDNNYIARSVPSGNDAWDLIKSEKFDLVLSDIQMNNGTGLELLEKIKSNESTSNIPVILITAFADQKELKKAKYTPDKILNKPFKMESLIESVIELTR